jgi:hypothetical protein
MNQEIVYKGLAQSAWAYNPDHRYGGMVILGGSPNEPEAVKRQGASDEEKREAYLKACAQLEELLWVQVEKMKTELVADSELQRIKKLNRRDFIDRMRSNEGLAGTLATLEVQTGWSYLKNYLEKLEAVTPEDIRAAANTYFTKTKPVRMSFPGANRISPPKITAKCAQSPAALLSQRNARMTTTTFRFIPPHSAGNIPFLLIANPKKLFTPRRTQWRLPGPKYFTCRTGNCPWWIWPCSLKRAPWTLMKLKWA